MTTSITTESLRAAYDKMVDELSQHSGVTIVENNLNAPASLSEQEEMLGGTGIPLTADLQAYLGFANGFSLKWTYEGGYVNGGSIQMIDLWTLPDSNQWPGPPDALEGAFDGYGIQAPKTHGAVYPIDFFQRHDENIELAGVIAGRETLDVFVSDDDIACITDAALISFGDYLELLFRSYGSPTARSALLMGSSNRDAKYARDLYPALFEKSYVIAKIIELGEDLDRSYFR